MLFVFTLLSGFCILRLLYEFDGSIVESVYDV